MNELPMNELLICIKPEGYIYYRTDADNATDAFKKYQEALLEAGINDDNVDYAHCQLRDAAGNDIDAI